MSTQSIMFAVVFTASAAFAGAYEIGEELANADFWSSDPVLFVQKHRDSGFKFTSETRENADSRRDGGVTCFGLPVYESRIAFAPEGGIARVELMLFNRGGTETVQVTDLADGGRQMTLSRNDKTVTRDEFFAILKGINNKLTPMGGGKRPAEVPARVKHSGDVQRSMTWPSSLPGPATMMWNYHQTGKKTQTFKPGFVRFVVNAPASSAKSTAASSSATGAGAEAKGAKTIIENVVRDSRGDVFIDGVPMVDQGEKGYCSAASAERVMRYYGLEVDEHDVAEAAGTSTRKGTLDIDMKNSVESIGKRYKLATTVLYGDFEKSPRERIDGLVNEARNYNKAAKKLKKAEIPESVYAKPHGNMIEYDPSALDAAMDPEVLREMKVNGAQKSKLTKFSKDIHQFVNMGVPLFWGVKLGIYPESDLPQTRGYHTRLIIGYNDKKKEFLYSDSWGTGHELKRMPIEWAWAISSYLMVMKPLR